MRIRVGEIDDYGGRTLSVDHGAIRFNTPHRAITSTEANYKSDVGFDGPYPNNIIEIIGLFDDDGLRRLREKNGIFGRRLRDTTARREAYGDILSMFQMHHPRGKIDQQFSSSDLKMLIELQIESGVDIVTIPDQSLMTSPEVFAKDVEDWTEYIISNSEAIASPRIDMASEPDRFRRKLDLLLERDSPVISLKYRSHKVYTPNFLTIWERSAENVWFHATAVDRIMRVDWMTSGLHVPQRWGIDTSSRSTILPPETPPPRDFDDVRRFDQTTLGIPKLRDYRRRHGDTVDCGCAVCENMNLTELVNRYGRDSEGGPDSASLDKWLKIHEALSGTHEFERSQVFISEGRFREYVRSKEFLNRQLPDASARRLDNFL